MPDIFKYDFTTLKKAILFNTKEILPSDPGQLDQEIHFLVDNANQSGQKIRHYIGFEISGQIHIGTGLAAALKIKKLQDEGVICSIWLADYHTWLNNKLDGKIETIRLVANQYFGPVMAQCLKVVGGNLDNFEILHSENYYHNHKTNNQTFWDFDLSVGKELTLSRVLKSVSIMGKEAGDGVEFSTLRYPVMQVADAFFLQTHIVHAGLDQRKCHVLMREVAHKLAADFKLRINSKSLAPLAIHHSLLHGLLAPETKDGVTEIAKMSKSKPDSAIWVHDSEEEIRRKIKGAFCPMPNANQSLEQIQNEQFYNPILNWCQNLIYPAGQIIKLQRPEKFGGDKLYSTFEELQQDYFENKIHPMDLKNAVSNTLILWLEPIREYITSSPQGLELVKSARK